MNETVPPDLTVQAWLNSASKQLNSQTDTPLADARRLLCERMDVSAEWLANHREANIPDNVLTVLTVDMENLLNGQPLPYVIGHWRFYQNDFIVSPAVLIPRPETEILVELGINWLNTHPGVTKILDVGTGSGCIPISIALACPQIYANATDISNEALAIAKQNAFNLGAAARVNFIHTNLVNGLDVSEYHLVTANLPYIPSEDLQLLRVSRVEPILALDGGPDGFEIIRKLLANLATKLQPPYLILLEIDYRQGDLAKEYSHSWFPEAEITLKLDYGNLPRIISIRREA